MAEHQNRVTTLYVELWGMPRAEVLYYCSTHDMGEQTAGDTPYGAKRLVPSLGQAVNEAEGLGFEALKISMPKLSLLEYTQFKICDLLEMYETAVVEKLMGNALAGPPITSCVGAALSLAVEVRDEHPEVLTRVQEWLKENPTHV